MFSLVAKLEEGREVLNKFKMASLLEAEINYVWNGERERERERAEQPIVGIEIVKE